MMKIELREIKTADFDFLWRLHNAALKDYVTQTWGWDENWQRENFIKTFGLREGKIIVLNGDDAGYLWIIEKEKEILLASIRLFPEYQNFGIGSMIFKNLLEKTKKPVRLQVLKVNPAQNLYARLGFQAIGETATHFIMESNPKDHNKN
jgi:ribosomal protein S18 acetylase RimI-like enzyme